MKTQTEIKALDRLKVINTGYESIDKIIEDKLSRQMRRISDESSDSL